MENTKYFGVLFSDEKILFRQVENNEWERYIGEGDWEIVTGAKARHEAIGANSDYIEIDEGIAKQIMLSYDHDVYAQ